MTYDILMTILAKQYNKVIVGEKKNMCDTIQP